MPQSLSAMYVHLVFSTYDRTPFLTDTALRGKLYAGMANISNRMECKTVAIGGVEDHVHILARLSPKVCLADWVCDIKSRSTPFVKKQPGLASFHWQAGYGAFSVNAADLASVRRYIESQQDHHRKESFQDEFRRILREHDTTWNEEYVWG